jgi:hypothetical protein
MSKWHDEVGKEKMMPDKIIYYFYFPKGEDEKYVLSKKWLNSNLKKKTKNLKMCRRRCMMKDARYIQIFKHLGKEFVSFWKKKGKKQKWKVVPHHANSSFIFKFFFFLSLCS